MFANTQIDLRELVANDGNSLEDIYAEVTVLSYNRQGIFGKRFLEELGEVVVSKDKPLRMLRFNKWDRADGGMLIHRGEDMAPLLLLWDCKSRNPVPQAPVSSSENTEPTSEPEYIEGDKNWEQASYWCDDLPSDEATIKQKVKAAALDTASTNYPQSALRSLAERQILFIYAYDWAKTTKVESRMSRDQNPAVAIRLNRAIMEKLLVFWFPLYLAARSLYDKYPKKEVVANG